MTTKKCYCCQTEKNIDDFGFNRRNKDKRRGECKECHSQNNSDYSKSELGKATRFNKTQRNRKFIYDFLQKSKCVDCGDTRWQVLEFDHVKGDKKYDVSHLINGTSSLKTIQDEIDKCEIRCANCHRLKTMKQFDLPKNNWEVFSTITKTAEPKKRIRSNPIVGEKSHLAKLCEADVLQIRADFGKHDGKDLAERYGVSSTTIYNVVNRKIWKHI